MDELEAFYYVVWFLAGLGIGLVARGGRITVRKTTREKYEFYCERHGWIELDKNAVEQHDRQAALLCPKCRRGLP